MERQELMECEHCLKKYPEKEIHESHDVPCYLFFIESHKRNERKNIADRFGRRYLCTSCHYNYEVSLRESFVKHALKFSKKYFEKEEDGASI